MSSLHTVKHFVTACLTSSLLELFFLSQVQEATAKLVKVVVLSRHGNRAPNAQIEEVCPEALMFTRTFNEPVQARVPAALSHVGMAECTEAGAHLRDYYTEGGFTKENRENLLQWSKRYPEKTANSTTVDQSTDDQTVSDGSPDSVRAAKKPIKERKLLPSAPYFDDGSVFFYSERMDRNVISTQSVARAMFPIGSGQIGFTAERPNLVPITTSTPFKDRLMNLPRDGPCKQYYKKTMKTWAMKNEASIAAANKELLDTFSTICGYDFLQNVYLDKNADGRAYLNVTADPNLKISEEAYKRAVKDTLAMKAKKMNLPSAMTNHPKPDHSNPPADDSSSPHSDSSNPDADYDDSSNPDAGLLDPDLPYPSDFDDPDGNFDGNSDAPPPVDSGISLTEAPFNTGASTRGDFGLTRLTQNDKGYVIGNSSPSDGTFRRFVLAALKKKGLAWGLKAAADFFKFATNEGIDTSLLAQRLGMDPTNSHDVKQFEATVKRATDLAGEIVNHQRFGTPEQITTWIGAFLQRALFANMKIPVTKKQLYVGTKLSQSQPWKLTQEEFFYRNRFLFFLNHRELVYAVASVLGIQELIENPVPPGGMLIWELHNDEDAVQADGETTKKEKQEIKAIKKGAPGVSLEDPFTDLDADGALDNLTDPATDDAEQAVDAEPIITPTEYIRTFVWRPSTPRFHVKKYYIDNQLPIADLYFTDENMQKGFGSRQEVFPSVCAVKGKCLLSELEGAYGAHIAQTGTWQEICDSAKRPKAPGDMTTEQMIDGEMNLAEDDVGDGDDEDGWRAHFEHVLFGDDDVHKAEKGVMEFDQLVGQEVAALSNEKALTKSSTSFRDIEPNFDSHFFQNFTIMNAVTTVFAMIGLFSVMCRMATAVSQIQTVRGEPLLDGETRSEYERMGP